MTTCIIYVLVLLCTNYVTNVKCNFDKSALYENEYLQTQNRREFYDESGTKLRISRMVTQIIPNDLKEKTWVPKFIGGEGRRAFYIGVRKSGPSDVFISRNDGYSYENETELFKLSNGDYSKIDQVYVHPKFKNCVIFTDKANKVIFSSTQGGYNPVRTEVEFTPNSIIYHDTNKDYLFTIDADNDKQLWLSDNFGSTWKPIHHKTLWTFWTTYEQLDEQVLVAFINEFNGMAIYSKDMFQNTSNIIDINVKSIYRRNKHVFIHKKFDDSNNYELYISTKLGEATKARFNDKLNNKHIRIVEVTDEGKIFAVVHHSRDISHLYVSSRMRYGELQFYLLLENIYSYAPGISTNIYGSLKGFDEFYKVEGVSGVYIASTQVESNPKQLESVITFDYGNEWRKVSKWIYDIHGNRINCPVCSFQLIQNTDSTKSPILSSKSAPGVVIATGKIENSPSSKDDSTDFYVSRDAGFSWRQSKLGSHRYQIANHGDLLATMQRDDKGQTKTQYISVSNNYGKTWEDEKIYNKDILVNTFVKTLDKYNNTFTVIGVVNSNRDRMVDVKLDLTPVERYDCREDIRSTWLENHKYLPDELAKEIAGKRHNLNSEYCYTWTKPKLRQ